MNETPTSGTVSLHGVDYKVTGIQLPEPVGWWLFPCGASSSHAYHIAAYHKPNWFHRTMMRVLLGFEWKDAEK